MAAAAPVIALVVTAAAAGYSAYSSEKAARAQERSADKAEDRAKRAAALRAADTEKQHRRVIASQEASYGAAGLTMEGSPLLVQQESLKESKEQLNRILEGGQYASDVYKQAGEEASMAGEAGAIKSLLSGSTSVYNQGAGYNWW